MYWSSLSYLGGTLCWFKCGCVASVWEPWPDNLQRIRCFELLKKGIYVTVCHGLDTVYNLDSYFLTKQACIDTKTDYVDMIADPIHMQNVVTNFDQAARESQVKILPGCGAVEVVVLEFRFSYKRTGPLRFSCFPSKNWITWKIVFFRSLCSQFHFLWWFESFERLCMGPIEIRLSSYKIRQRKSWSLCNTQGEGKEFG